MPALSRTREMGSLGDLQGAGRDGGERRRGSAPRSLGSSLINRFTRAAGSDGAARGAAAACSVVWALMASRTRGAAESCGRESGSVGAEQEAIQNPEKNHCPAVTQACVSQLAAPPADAPAKR